MALVGHARSFLPLPARLCRSSCGKNETWGAHRGEGGRRRTCGLPKKKKKNDPAAAATSRYSSSSSGSSEVERSTFVRELGYLTRVVHYSSTAVAARFPAGACWRRSTNERSPSAGVRRHDKRRMHRTLRWDPTSTCPRRAHGSRAPSPEGWGCGGRGIDKHAGCGSNAIN